MKLLITKDLFTKNDLILAWERYVASVGLDAKDYFGISLYEKDINKNLENLLEQLQSNNYSPVKPFKYYEPKKGGTQRTKTVLVIEDALVYQIIGNKIAEKLYSYLRETHQNVFGSVLNESVEKGEKLLFEEEPDFYFFEYYVTLYNRFIENINSTIEGGVAKYRLETDITGFFDCIPHSTLVLKLNKFGIRKEILDLLSRCLNSWTGTRESSTFFVGIPQGPATSFLLANLILDGLDRIVINQNIHYYRFLDDIRIYSETKEELYDILAEIDRFLKGNSLSLNSKKTTILSINDEEEEKERMLDSSGIKVTDKKVNRELKIDSEVLIQDPTQLKKKKFKSRKISKNNALILLRIALENTEISLKKTFIQLEDKKSHDSISNNDIREFINLSQKWRITTKAILDIQYFEPNKELVDIWFFGIENFFWKCNSLVWNLKLYSDLSDFSQVYSRIYSSFKRFEWVQYQLLAIFDKFQPENSEKLINVYKNLVIESSPLVRLGYYSILLEAIETNTKLFDLVASNIKLEEEDYVKNSVLNMIHKRNYSIPIESLKAWFL